MSTAGRVIKNTAILTFGQIVTLVLGMVFTALLSRHIGPEGYGKYAFAHSTIAMMMVFVSFGFSTLPIRNVAQKREEASKYFSNIVFMKALLSFVVFSLFLIAVLAGNYSRDMISLMLLVGASAILEALTQVSVSIFYAFEKMKYDVLTQVVRAVAALGLGAGAIFLGCNLIQIVAVLIFASVLRATLTLIMLWGKIVKFKLEVDLGFCKKIVIASIPFSLLIVVSAIFSNVSVVMLGSMVGDGAAGWYASAIRVIEMLLIVPGMFLTSIYPVFSRFYASSKESLALSYSKSFDWGLLLGLPMAAGIFLVADRVIALIFGPGFENAADALRLLSVVVLVGFCNNVNGAILNAMGREKFFAALSTATVAVVVVLNWLLIPRFSYVGPAITYDIATGLGFVIYSLLCHRWLNLALPWKTALKGIAATCGMAAFVHLALREGVNLLAVIAVIGPVIYGVFLYLLRGFSTEDVLLLKRALKWAGPRGKKSHAQ